MKINTHRFYRNREAVIKGAALFLLDAVLVIACMAGALWMRFDFSFTSIEPVFLESIRSYMWINVICTLLINAVCRLYTSLWRFASLEELKNAVVAIVLSSFIQFFGMQLLDCPVPRSYIFIYTMLLAVCIIGPRFSYRFLRIAFRNHEVIWQTKPVVTMVVGAGAAGYMLVREMKNSKHLNRKVPCIIDDDPKKIGTYLQGIPIVGNKEDIPETAKKYGVEEIIIAIPTLKDEKQHELLEICQQTACKIKMLPGIYQMVNQEVDISMLRDVSIEDLLGREPVDLHMETIGSYITGKTILVTGGGGSIGSEICRQVALHEPKQLIIVDIYENNAYDIQLELKKNYPDYYFEYEGIKPFPYLRDLLSILKDRGRKVAIVSSTDRAHLEAALSRMGLSVFIDTIISGNDVQNKKPSPEPYLKGLEALSVDKQDAVVIEDSPTGIQSAVNAGIDCIGFEGSEVKQDTEKASIIIASYKEMIEAIN